MNMPKPGPEHERLMRFVGDWSGDEKLAPSPWGEGGPAFGSARYSRRLDGMGLLLDYRQQINGATVFDGHGVFLIEASTGDVLWWWFDSMAIPPEGPARGRWNGDTLLFEKTTAQGVSRYGYQLRGERYEFWIENKFPGQSEFTRFLTGEYARHD